MMISFVIPAYNEELLLGRALGSIAQATAGIAHGHEVIVVDDGSTDATARVATELGARVVAVKLRHIAAARNAGARDARGDVLVFLDADTQLPAATLRAAIAALDAGAIGGGAAVAMDQRLPRAAEWTLRLWNTMSRRLRWAAGCFIFVRSDAFREVGGFDEQYYVSEEIFLSNALKRRGRFVIVPEPVMTSARKTRMYPMWWLLWRSLWLMARGKRAFRKRAGLEMWYAGRRETAAPVAEPTIDQGFESPPTTPSPQAPRPH